MRSQTRGVRAAFPILLLLASLSPAADWQKTPSGQLLLYPFANTAPYPHPSRADGYKSQNGAFPKDPHYTDSTIGIVIPPHYHRAQTVDYVVHFHGWSNHVSQVIPQYRLADQLAASGVNAILLVPQGPKDAKDSGGGKLELDPGAFKRLIEEVTTFLKSEDKLAPDAALGRIALSAHSGGYKVTARILHHGGLTPHISDVILLDASYGNLDDFVEFAAEHPDARTLSFHTQHLDDENAQLKSLLDKAHLPSRQLDETSLTPDTLAPRGGITFIPTKLPHNDVPMKSNYFRLSLESSALPKLATIKPPARAAAAPAAAPTHRPPSLPTSDAPPPPAP